MIFVQIKVIEGVNHPAEPFPADAVQIVCDGEKYIVYQPGDEIPTAPAHDSNQLDHL